MRTILVLMMLSVLAPIDPAHADNALPTPYTAEQIRDASREGMWVITRVTTPEGTVTSKTEVVAWSEAGVTFLDQPLDDQGEPVGKGRPIEATWEELRQHAMFPPDETHRERLTRETPLGELTGWRYVHQRPNGSIGTFFFADDYPGAPVVYTDARGGEITMTAEQIAHQPAPAPSDTP